MTSGFQPGATITTGWGFGVRPENIEVPHYDVRAPTTSDFNYPIGKMWDWAGNGVWRLNQLSTAGGVTSATWLQLASGSGDVVSVTGTANQITSSPTSGAVVLSIPAVFTAPGSIASTTTLTGGTGITATTGNITATTGNFVASAAASGLVLTPTVTSGAASGTVAANGRVVSVTFTGVSIASGATQAFTTSNTSITGSGTVLSLSWSGATAGSALSVVSIANTAGQSVITMTNGTSATMVTSIANITFTYFVLN